VHTPLTIKKQRVLWTREENGVEFKLVIDTFSDEGVPYLRVGGVGLLPVSVYHFPWEPEYRSPTYGNRVVDIPDNFLDEIRRIVEETWPSGIRTGRVKKWFRDRYYGFLSQEGEPDVYFRFNIPKLCIRWLPPLLEFWNSKSRIQRGEDL
jgi:hypothetical protein